MTAVTALESSALSPLRPRSATFVLVWLRCVCSRTVTYSEEAGEDVDVIISAPSVGGAEVAN
jgi:hypothetical protein